jgi:hypothetical protein
MPLSDEDYNKHSTCFGLWSAAKAARVSELLDSLGVRYEFVIREVSEDVLRAYLAWDPTSVNPCEGHDLYIHHDDLEKVGTRIVELYPERKFGAK